MFFHLIEAGAFKTKLRKLPTFIKILAFVLSLKICLDISSFPFCLSLTPQVLQNTLVEFSQQMDNMAVELTLVSGKKFIVLGH